MRRSLAIPILAALLAAAPASAITASYSAAMTGAQEVPGPGDVDGSASGTITLNSVTGAISWSITYADILAPTDFHIHGPAAEGASAIVFIGLGAATTVAGTLTNSLIADPTLVAQVVADPTNFYLNIHNGDFPLGAIRDQLGTIVPEPGTLALLGAALGTFALRRKESR